MNGTPADDDSLKRAALRGSAWTMAGYGASQVLRFLSNVAFTWLLYKEAFALMMIVNATVQGLQMFSDVGIGPSVVQHPRGDDRRFLGTAFTLQVLRGVLLAAICLGLTWPIAAHYADKDPTQDLVRLLPLAALSVLIGGFCSTRLFTASRHLALGRVTMIDLAAQVVGVGTTIVYAFWHRDVLALVLGSVTAAITKLVLSHTVLPGPRDTFAWDRTAAPAILSFGGWIFVSTVASFFAMQLDRFVFPDRFTLDESGDYNLAANIALMVPSVVGSLQLAVVFPLYSRVLAEGRHVGPYVAKVKGAVFAVAGLLIAWAIAGGQPFVSLVYDQRWQAAGWMVAVLSIGAWFQIVESLYGAALLARGKAQWVALANGVKPVVFVLWILVAGQAVDFASAIVAWTLADLAKAAVSMAGAVRYGVLTPRLDATMTLLALGTGGGLWWLAEHLRTAWNAPPLAVLAAVAAGGLLVFAPALRTAARTLANRGREAGVP
jgi:O-antigen/teichoic acid export membrane protein